jgi:hypothetical protein
MNVIIDKGSLTPRKGNEKKKINRNISTNDFSGSVSSHLGKLK